jgi:hypothetical protein
MGIKYLSAFLARNNTLENDLNSLVLLTCFDYAKSTKRHA